MARMKVGILHPGAMGVSVAASAKNGGHLVYWAANGRSPDTRDRARNADLLDAGQVFELCKIVDIIISVCPPHAAEEVLTEVLKSDFSGIYVDANAISPHKSRWLADRCAQTGVPFVGGSIVGGPAWEPDTTTLFLCGEQAELIAGLFEAGPLGACDLGTQIGRAAALKMCFAAYTKGSTALVSAVLALAEETGVRKELMELWAEDGSGFVQEAERRTRRVVRKAWRFAGEMDEIAETFTEAGLPGGFHRASGEVYRRLAHLQTADPLPDLDEVLSVLIRGDGKADDPGRVG